MALLDGFNLDRVLPTLRELPVPGADFVTPQGVRIKVGTVCSIEPGRLVATGTPSFFSRGHRFNSNVHCFMFFWENQNGS